MKSACKNLWTSGSSNRFTSSGVPTVRMRPSLMTAMRSATPNARSRSWDTTSDVTPMRCFKLRISSPMMTEDEEKEAQEKIDTIARALMAVASFDGVTEVFAFAIVAEDTPPIKVEAWVCDGCGHAHVEITPPSQPVRWSPGRADARLFGREAEDEPDE